MASYLIKSSLCLLALLAFYHLVLEKEKMHKFNRFYLLGSVLFSFCAPLFVIYVEATQIPVEITPLIPLQESFINVENQPSLIVKEKFDYTQLFYGVYGLVTLFLFTRFFKNISNIFIRIKDNSRIKINNATIVLLEESVIPHTFWSYVFINKKEYESENFNSQLLTHELTHVAQFHTLDILCIEILKIVFWFNPLLYILKRLLQLNHEFLADEKVIETHKNIGNYQSLLLEKSIGKTPYQLTSNLNYLVTKKRLKMMTKRTHKYSWVKQLAIAPLVVGLFFVFAERVEAQTKDDKKENIETIVEEIPFNPNEKLEDSEIYKEYFYRKGLYQFKDKNGKYISKTYDELNEEEKIRLMPPTPLKRSKKPITDELFQKLKNKENYAVWIDGKVVDNKKLNDYKYSDFSRHSVSFVYKNARSERFPQNYQAHLETHQYFKEQDQKRVEDFHNFIKERYNITEVQEVVPSENKKKKSSNEKAKKYNFPSSNGSKQSAAKKETPKSFLMRNNTVSNFSYNSIDYINDTKSATSKMTKEQKKSFKYINHIVKVSTLNSKAFNYEIEGKKSNVNEVFDFILENPECFISFKKIADNKLLLLFENKKKLKLSDNDYQLIYNEVFKLSNKTTGQKTKIPVIQNKKDTTNVKFNKDWYITINDEKYYYTFDKNERVARYYKNGKLANLDIVEEYKKKHKVFEKLKSEGRHYVFKTKEEQKVIDKEFSDLGGMYFRMSRADKNKVPFPENPKRPYIRLKKGDKVWYKKKEDLTEEEKLLLPPAPSKANTSETEKEKYKKALKEWTERTSSNSYNLPSSNGSKNNIIKKPLLKNVIVNKKVFIIIDNDTFKISYDSTFENIVSISFEQIEKMISNLSNHQIKNTFIFSKTNDFKKFRKLPSSAEEYKDDLEIFIVKADYEIMTLKDKNDKKSKFPKFHMALDNKDKINYKSKVSQLGELFKRYSIKNLTI